TSVSFTMRAPDPGPPGQLLLLNPKRSRRGAVKPLDFRNVKVGRTSTRTVLLRNTGSGPLTVTVEPSGQAPFRAVAGAETFTLAAGSAPRAVAVQFAPTARGRFTGQLVLTSNDPDGADQRVAINLRGRGK
ncbi:MAG TPA: choice-of-anchor D domain-containing protein, partial [Armatimonadota bacterium]|nr:choice-of-anchor D domain-containing protein [Armatimonadota bacterium]